MDPSLLSSTSSSDGLQQRLANNLRKQQQNYARQKQLLEELEKPRVQLDDLVKSEILSASQEIRHVEAPSRLLDQLDALRKEEHESSVHLQNKLKTLDELQKSTAEMSSKQIEELEAETLLLHQTAKTQDQQLACHVDTIQDLQRKLNSYEQALEARSTTITSLTTQLQQQKQNQEQMEYEMMKAHDREHQMNSQSQKQLEQLHQALEQAKQEIISCHEQETQLKEQHERQLQEQQSCLTLIQQSHSKELEELRRHQEKHLADLKQDYAVQMLEGLRQAEEKKASELSQQLRERKEIEQNLQDQMNLLLLQKTQYEKELAKMTKYVDETLAHQEQQSKEKMENLKRQTQTQEKHRVNELTNIQMILSKIAPAISSHETLDEVIKALTTQAFECFMQYENRAKELTHELHLQQQQHLQAEQNLSSSYLSKQEQIEQQQQQHHEESQHHIQKLENQIANMKITTSHDLQTIESLTLQTQSLDKQIESLNQKNEQYKDQITQYQKQFEQIQIQKQYQALELNQQTQAYQQQLTQAFTFEQQTKKFVDLLQAHLDQQHRSHSQQQHQFQQQKLHLLNWNYQIERRRNAQRRTLFQLEEIMQSQLPGTPSYPMSKSPNKFKVAGWTLIAIMHLRARRPSSKLALKTRDPYDSKDIIEKLARENSDLNAVVQHLVQFPVEVQQLPRFYHLYFQSNEVRQPDKDWIQEVKRVFEEHSDSFQGLKLEQTRLQRELYDLTSETKKKDAQLQDWMQKSDSLQNTYKEKQKQFQKTIKDEQEQRQTQHQEKVSKLETQVHAVKVQLSKMEKLSRKIGAYQQENQSLENQIQQLVHVCEDQSKQLKFKDKEIRQVQRAYRKHQQQQQTETQQLDTTYQQKLQYYQMELDIAKNRSQQLEEEKEQIRQQLYQQLQQQAAKEEVDQSSEIQAILNRVESALQTTGTSTPVKRIEGLEHVQDIPPLTNQSTAEQINEAVESYMREIDQKLEAVYSFAPSKKNNSGVVSTASS